ncbi:MAG: chorismate synthase [Planctomycetota bacterium]
MLSYLTAGESHGDVIVSIIEGLPAGLAVDINFINQELKLRQGGFGRGRRMKMEKDRVQILTGLRRGKTIGSPVTLMIKNLVRNINQISPLTNVRPGHADLAGAMKLGLTDARDVAERASARETTGRVVAGALAKILLHQFNIKIFGYVTQIGGIDCCSVVIPETTGIYKSGFKKIDSAIERIRNHSSFYSLTPGIEPLWAEKIKEAKNKGDTLGGVFEIIAFNVPVGLGHYAQWHQRLDGRLAQALMAIPSVKGVESGLGFWSGKFFGSEVHDSVKFSKGCALMNAGGGFARRTNKAGGLEGGMTNGENIVLRAAVKPIPTLQNPLPSINLKTKRMALAGVERSDTCVVPAALVVGEAVVAFEIARSFLDKFGGDSMDELDRNFTAYQRELKEKYFKNL